MSQAILSGFNSFGVGILDILFALVSAFSGFAVVMASGSSFLSTKLEPGFASDFSLVVHIPNISMQSELLYVRRRPFSAGGFCAWPCRALLAIIGILHIVTILPLGSCSNRSMLFNSNWLTIWDDSAWHGASQSWTAISEGAFLLDIYCTSSWASLELIVSFSRPSRLGISNFPSDFGKIFPLHRPLALHHLAQNCREEYFRHGRSQDTSHFLLQP